VYKSLGVPSLSRAYLSRAMLDENVQYLGLAFFWFTQVSHPSPPPLPSVSVPVVSLTFVICIATYLPYVWI
jgi:hypothetical protein